jgi:hypothetical protein
MRRSPEHPSVKASQHRVRGSSDGVEAAVDQHFDVGIGFGNGGENLPATRLRFDVTDPHLQMPLAVLTAANERRVQRHRNRRHRQRRFRFGHGLIAKCLTDLQGMPANGLRILSGINRKHLLQHISSHPVRHRGRRNALEAGPIPVLSGSAMANKCQPRSRHTRRSENEEDAP